MGLEETAAVLDELDGLGWWYQHFQLPNGLWTGDGREPGYDPRGRWHFMEPFIPADVSGKTVLDLGGNSGYFSIQMKLRGASRCVLVDAFPEFGRQAEFAARQFQVEVEVVNQDAHVYCLTTSERFDYVFFLGLFYHLKYPGLVLDRAAEMTKERLFLASALVGPEVDTPAEKPDYERYSDDGLLLDPAFPKLAFVETRYNNDPTNWWLPNYSALPALVRSAGLRVVARPHSHLIVAEPEHCLGKVVLGDLVFPRYGKGDGAVYPDSPAIDAGLWSALSGKARDFHLEQRRALDGRRKD
jgi:tRNA (mo5U34)-methyltransferase